MLEIWKPSTAEFMNAIPWYPYVSGVHSFVNDI